MSNTASPPLHPLLLSSMQQIRRSVLAAAERTVHSLGLATLAASSAQQREVAQAAQVELERNMAAFGQAFETSYGEQVLREQRSTRGPGPQGGLTNWQDLSLVEDLELDQQVRAERFGLEIGHSCEWELRELDAYIGSLLGQARAEPIRSPLRPELIGHGVIRALNSVSQRPEVRRVLEAELNRSLAAMLRATYGEIVTTMRKAGIQPASLTVRTTESRADAGPSRAGALDSADGDRSMSSTHGALGGSHPPGGRGAAAWGRAGATGPGSFGHATGGGAGAGTPIGHVEPGMMALLRSLAVVEPGGGEAGGSGWGTPQADGSLPVLPNVIHANRDALRQASRGALDHMVIDVIGSLFDQILSDPKVPPQLARQIARLQLPVLRAALGDPSFFASRRHPVRLFVNRIASLANGFDDFDDAQAQSFVARVRELVQEIVNGDFDQIETYETRLAALEASVAEQARAAVDAGHAGATELLRRREQAAHVERQFAERLERDLQTLAAPAFVRDFVARVWSRVILTAAEQSGLTSERVRELRRVGRDLFMSVQPKASPAQRKTFLAELPKLMRSINDGLNSIGWPDDRRRAFFGQLMPAHAEALKVAGSSVLDFNMLSHQVGQVLEREVPSASELPPVTAPIDELPDQVFSREEAERIGLVDERSVDWTRKVDIEVAAEPEVTAVDLELPGLPSPAEPPEPTRGASLADHVQIGFCYQMHLEGDWRKVRLAHVSPGRTFFVFTHGQRHQRTVSLTHRMLTRMGETNRLRAYESAQLLERATARARRQLSALATAQPR